MFSAVQSNPKVKAARAICAVCEQKRTEDHWNPVTGHVFNIERCAVCNCAVSMRTAFVLVGHHCPANKW